MSIDSVSRKAFLEKVSQNYNQNRNSKNSAYEGFAGNLKERVESEENIQEQVSENWTTTHIDYHLGKVASELLLQKTGRVEMGAVMETSVRHISYGESDNTKVCVKEGYTLKAQVDMDAHKVYIEQKNEDGTYQAYEVSPLKVAEDTENPIEQMALESWEMAKELLNDGMFTEIEADGITGTQSTKEEGEITDSVTFKEMLDKFEEFVEKRIKEGPPKIQIGGAEFSEEEWEQLLRKIDKDIDAYKEELRERIRKQQEEEALKRTTGSAVEEEGLGDVAVSEQKGTSFLARLSGTKKAPYSYLADESGVIMYNGVTFICKDEKQQICLGDMSDSKNVINIPLAKGGCLKVNRDNLGDLAKAISMFSPEDIGRIMRAISQDTKVKQVEFEIEEMT